MFAFVPFSLKMTEDMCARKEAPFMLFGASCNTASTIKNFVIFPNLSDDCYQRQFNGPFTFTTNECEQI